MGELDVRSWGLKDPLQINRLGNLTRFSFLLADYESVRRRADAEHPEAQIGGQDRGRWYYHNLATYIVNYAQGAYDGFDGEAGYALDAVDLTTVHRAKGLEWSAVFVPSMTEGRFPSPKTGRHQRWLVPRDRFAAARYEGSDADERRLFYVAMTRARDWLSISRHKRVNVRATGASPYYREFRHLEVARPRMSAQARSTPARSARTTRSPLPTASWLHSSTAAPPSGCATSLASNPAWRRSWVTARPSITSCGQ